METLTSVLPSLKPPGRREKLFGEGRPRPMSRHHKVNLMREARRLRRERSTEPGKHITRSDVDVLYELLWRFHNEASGLCFPGYEAIAEAAGCARSTVYEAIKRLEAAGLMSWVNRIKRVYERVVDMFGQGVHGQRSRVLRTSNGYRFAMLDVEQSSKSENASGTEGQEIIPLTPAPKPIPPALDRLEKSRQWMEDRRNRTAARRGGS